MSDSEGRKDISVPAGVFGLEVNRKTGKTHPIHEGEQLERYFPTIERLVVQDFENNGMTRKDAANTLRVNTELLENRVRKIAEPLKLSAHHHVAELGCGFGFCSLGLHKVTGARITGFDINPRFLELGNTLLAAHPELTRYVDFRQLDYTSESPGNQQFDAVILNNTFCYIVGRDRQHAAISNIYDSLVPGGAVCFYHFNPWFFREPFTKLPMVHWLPRKIGDTIARKLGRRQLSDLHYISPSRLGKRLLAAGFTDIQFLPGGLKPFTWRHPTQALRPYYALTAKRC